MKGPRLRSGAPATTGTFALLFGTFATTAALQLQNQNHDDPPATQAEVDEPEMVCIGLPQVYPKNTELPLDETRPDEFAAGAILKLRCQSDFVTGNGGEPPVMVCQEDGYFKADYAGDDFGCVPKPTCPAPRKENHNAEFLNILHNAKGAQYKCSEGYSLDGRDGGSYGAGGNMNFWVSCDTVNEVWNDWEGKCKEVQINEAEAFKSVFQILFTVDCKNGVLRPSLFKAKSGHDYAKKMCKGAEGDAKATCDGMVGKLESDLKADWEGRETTAEAFCDKMWTDVVGGDAPEEF